MGSPSTIQNLFDPIASLAKEGKILAPASKRTVPPKITPAVTADDPAISAAMKAQREAELKRKGRASTIVTGGAGLTGDAPLSQPQALGA